MKRPDISVIMSVYNTKPEYLKLAIESILEQTYQNFEFIIIDDCSSDNSLSIINNYAETDKRIIVIKNQINMGLTKSLNKGLKIAKGEFIARMDADDYSLPWRFKKQLEYLRKHHDVGAVGGYGYVGKKKGRALAYWVKGHDRLHASMMLRNSGIPHPSAMFRRIQNDGYIVRYDENIKKSQDYALWAEIVKHANIVLLPMFLIIYRVHPGQISSQYSTQRDYSRKVIVKQVKEYLKIDDSLAEKISHLSDSKNQLSDKDATPLFETIQQANQSVKYFKNSSIEWIVNEMKCERYYICKVSIDRPHVGIGGLFSFIMYYYGTRIKYDFSAFLFYHKYRKLIDSVIDKG